MRIKTIFLLVSVLLIGNINAQTFHDQPSNENDGDIPSKWEILTGSAIISSFEGVKVIEMENKTIISPKITANNYLEDSFSLLFDAYFDEVYKSVNYQSYEIRFWEGTAGVSIPYETRDGFYAPIVIRRHGVKIDGRADNNLGILEQSYDNSLKDNVSTWRSINIQYNQGNLKIIIEGIEILDLAHFNYKPTMISIGVVNNTRYTDCVSLIKNIEINGINLDMNMDTDETNEEEENTTTTDVQDYAYALPTEDGDPHQILETDGNGTVSWVDHEHSNENTSNSAEQSETITGLKINDLLDGKSDAGSSSIFLGLSAGENDDGTSNQNVGIGFEALKNNTTGRNNISIGNQSLVSNNVGESNIAIGVRSLNKNTDGNKNTAIGSTSLFNNTSGNENTANGFGSLFSNTTGSKNTAIGFQTLVSNTTGDVNTAIGYRALYSNTFGPNNTANGFHALYSNTSGSGNTANGSQALADNTSGKANTANGFRALYRNTIGDNNTANGSYALVGNTTGNDNTANGFSALVKNKTGYRNTAIGSQALYSNTIGFNNTANGFETLTKNTTGKRNTAIGNMALYNNTTANENAAIGSEALFSNTIGQKNVANGVRALFMNIEGNENVANGTGALFSNTVGNKNVANGAHALFKNIEGNENIAIGFNALYSNLASGSVAVGHLALYSNSLAMGNTAIGFHSLKNNTDGSSNTAIGSNTLNQNSTGAQNFAGGYNALRDNTMGHGNTAIGTFALSNNTTGSNNTAIGLQAKVPSPTASDQIRIGNTEVRYAGIQVAWTVTSDKTWKEKIRDLPYGLDLVSQLKPVDYIRKNNVNKTREMGFIAQDLEASLKKFGYLEQGFLTKDDEGKLSLRYNDLLALLTKAIQEQQSIIDNQSKKIEDLSSSLIAKDDAISSLNRRVKKIEAILNTNKL